MKKCQHYLPHASFTRQINKDNETLKKNITAKIATDHFSLLVIKGKTSDQRLYIKGELIPTALDDQRKKNITLFDSLFSL